ncbi:MAG TPA: isochorismate synthase [Oscillatoriales cyanobacterium M59_W2019_021]|nr:MAG: isochorismate synthase [Cyanobacteria bacterium J055]HIK31563.1 isochorismate synthase [Oscillatoriales cyanobacterium M4454_W2019_049]HIK50559.1 isochorismate synthase [Oscillatoriales cyanobacterium M59_W2019_021]
MESRQNLAGMLQYLWDGVKRIFTARDDNYPETGVQPFEGEPFDEQKQHNW